MKTFLLTAVIALAVAGCGDSAAPSNNTKPSPQKVEEAKRSSVQADQIAERCFPDAPDPVIAQANVWASLKGTNEEMRQQIAEWAEAGEKACEEIQTALDRQG